MNIKELLAKRAQAWEKCVEYRDRSDAGGKFTRADDKDWQAQLDEVERLGKLIEMAQRGQQLEQVEFDPIVTGIGTGANTGELRYGRPIPAGRSFMELPNTRGVSQDEAQAAAELFFRATVLNEEERSDLTARATRSGLIEGIGAQGGYLVPEVVSANIWDKARQNSVTTEAGVQVVPFTDRPGGTFTLPFVATDPVFAWESEGATSAETAPTIGARTLTPFTLRGVVTASREVIQDAASNVGQLVVDVSAKRIGEIIDSQILTGSASGPVGLLYYPGLTSTSTNSASDLHYDHLIDAVARRRAVDEHPGAAIMSPRNAAQLGKSKESSTLAYLAPPRYLDGVKLLDTSAVPTNLTIGGGSDISPTFVGDFSQSILAVRSALEIQPLTERYADSYKVGWLVACRVDFVVMRTAAIEVIYTGTT